MTQQNQLVRKYSRVMATPYKDRDKFIKIYILSFYLFSNLSFLIIYLFPDIFIITGLFRDRIDISLYTPPETVILAFLIVTFSYIFIGYYCFNSIWNYCLKLVQKKATIKRDSFGLFWFVLANQFFYLFVYIATGYGRAGGVETPGSIFIIYYFALFSSDYIFLIYYAVENNSKHRIINELLYILSSILRGWMGGLFIILMVEMIRLYRSKKLNKFKISFLSLGVIALSPFLMNARGYFRSDTVSFDYETILNEMRNIFDIKYQSIYDFLISLIYNVFSRFQQLTTTVALLENRETIYSDFISGKFQNFLTEGWVGIFLRNVYGELPPLFMKYITAYLASLSGYPIDIKRASSTNPTIMGWIIFSDIYWIFIYVVYLLILMFTSVYFMCYLSASERAKDMLWLIWILLLIAGWNGAIELVIQTQIVLIIYFIMSNLIKSKR